MPRIKWDDIEESSGGEYEKVEPGAYVVAIQSVVHKPEREYVEVLYDIVEGKFAGKYSEDFWADKPYAHHVFLSYKPKALGMLKGRLRMITESNPGFDAMAAFDADQWGLFIGKRFGLVLGEEEYEGNDGNVKTRLTDVAWKTVQQVHDGDYKVPECKRLKREAGAYYADTAAAVDYSGAVAMDDIDVPF